MHDLFTDILAISVMSEIYSKLLCTLDLSKSRTACRNCDTYLCHVTSERARRVIRRHGIEATPFCK